MSGINEIIHVSDTWYILAVKIITLNVEPKHLSLSLPTALDIGHILRLETQPSPSTGQFFPLGLDLT